MRVVVVNGATMDVLGRREEGGGGGWDVGGGGGGGGDVGEGGGGAGENLTSRRSCEKKSCPSRNPNHPSVKKSFPHIHSMGPPGR